MNHVVESWVQLRERILRDLLSDCVRPGQQMGESYRRRVLGPEEVIERIRRSATMI